MAFKVKFRTLFPALVNVQSPILLTKQGFTYTFGFDSSQLPAQGVSTVNGQSGAITLGFEAKARVSLTSGVPVTESDVAGAANIFVMPAGHNFTLISDGTNDLPKSYSQLQITLDATNALSGKNYDIWMALSGSVVVVGYGPDWSAGGGSNAMGGARGSGAGSTAYVLTNGRPVNANSITIRKDSGTTYTIPAGQANLVGGFRCTANGLTEDSALNRLVWSTYAVTRYGSAVDVTNNWSYSTASYRVANGNSANRVAVLAGLPGRLTRANVLAYATNSTSTVRPVTPGVGINSTTVNSAQVFSWADAVSATHNPCSASYKGYSGATYFEAYPLERGNGTDTQTWYGSVANFAQCGINLEIDN